MKVNPKVYDALDELGVPAHILGYEYLAAGVQYLLDNKDDHPSMTKDLYPNVGKALGSTASRYERACRHAVDVVFDQVHKEEVFTKYFGNSVDPNRGKVTLAHFLYAIKHKILLGSNG